MIRNSVQRQLEENVQLENIMKTEKQKTNPIQKVKVGR
jgi:hypothetical protein